MRLILSVMVLGAAVACTPAPTELPEEFDASFDF